MPSGPCVQMGRLFYRSHPSLPAQALRGRPCFSLPPPPAPPPPVPSTPPPLMNYHTMFHGGPPTILTAAAAVKDAAGAPWACSVSPFVDAEPLEPLCNDDGQRQPPLPPPVPIGKVARCEECFAYISQFSDITPRFVQTTNKNEQKRKIASETEYGFLLYRMVD